MVARAASFTFIEGEEAFKRGSGRRSNPYHGIVAKRRSYDDWNDGYDAAFKASKSSLSEAA